MSVQVELNTIRGGCINHEQDVKPLCCFSSLKKFLHTSSVFENLFLTPNTVIHCSLLQPPVYTKSESVFVLDNVCLCLFVYLPTVELIWTCGLLIGMWVDACQMQLAGSSCSSSHRSEVLERTYPPACSMSGHLISSVPLTMESKKALCSDKCLRKTS